MVPTIDEFGGYSSRLRIPDSNLYVGSADDTAQNLASDNQLSKQNGIKIRIQTSTDKPPALKKKSKSDLPMQTTEPTA